MNARLPGQSSAAHTDNHVDDKEQDRRQDHVHFHVAPEHHSGDILGGLSKGDGLKEGERRECIRITAIKLHESIIRFPFVAYRVSQVLRLVDQQLYSFPSRSHIVYILHHDVLQLINLAVHLIHDRGIAHLIKASHFHGQHLRKLRVHSVGNGRGHSQSILGHKLAGYLLQEDKGTTAFEFLEDYTNFKGWFCLMTHITKATLYF